MSDAQTPAAAGSIEFTVFFRGSPVGRERVVVTRQGQGWNISVVSSLGPPFGLVADKFELGYGADWQPQTLQLEGTLRGQAFGLSTKFSPTTATNEVAQGPERASTTQPISPRTVVLPNSIFGAYEAFAARLATATPGTEFDAYVPLEAEVKARVDRITPRRLSTPDGAVELRDFSVTLSGQTGPVPLSVWVDASQRLARVSLPAASVVAIRSDLTSVLVREETIRNPGDSESFIPGNGFNIAATLTRPASPVGKLPVVIFVSSPGPQGRDYVAYGIPILGQLAGRVAEAGLLAIRYDGRGTGQSGGRTESANLGDYAADVLSIIQWLRRRSDVDSERIILVGYDEGGPVALTAASREKRVKGVALLASPGRNGSEVTLEQQQRLLAGLAVPEPERVARRALQTRINQAAITGKGWEGIPASLRMQAESAWFKSWLQFDPADTIKRLDQPILIVHGAIDRELTPDHADRLEQLSQLRKRPGESTKKVVVPGVNHLLVPAATGDIDEYPGLEARTVSAAVAEALAAWLPTAVARR